MPTDWQAELGFPGVFDGRAFDEIIFDCFFQESPEVAVTGNWTKESSTSSSWTPQSSTA